MGKTYTLRGKVTEGSIKQLIVDDGRLTHGLRVTKFIVAPELSSIQSGFAVLGLDDKITAEWDWENANQIAWSSCNMAGTSKMEGPVFSLVDPDHIVIRDLFIRCVMTGSDPQHLNYFIELEAQTISDFEAIIQLTKEAAQS